jgi:sugar lactone lactonase YvrE
MLLMARGASIEGVRPEYAIPGGEIAVDCVGFEAGYNSGHRLIIGEDECHLNGASATRLLAVIPEQFDGGYTNLQLKLDGAHSELYPIVVGKRLIEGMHIVANPAIDPTDDALILTRSGSRGQHLPVTLFRLEPDGYLDELPEAILNPTGIAFDKEGQMFVTNRAQGEVYQVGRDGTTSVYATGLGIATGIAFDPNGGMYVGDRLGTIYCVSGFADVDAFAKLEASVAAYHMAFGPDERLYVTAPGLASHDAVYAIDRSGEVQPFFRGLGRPQGLAFDTNGNLYAVGCYQGRHGIVRISPDGSSAEQFVAGPNVVGLCFTRAGDMIVATGDSVYSIPCGIQGVLLN